MAAKSKSSPKTPPADKLIDAALALASEKGWENVSLNDIAETSGLKLSEMRGLIETRADILALYGRRIDQKVMERLPAVTDNMPPRDRLFDIIMERFDVLNEDRNGVKAILSSFRQDPKQAVFTMPHLARSLTWMMEAAGIEATGRRGALKLAGLTALYVRVLKIWCRDESEDLSETMAALDKYLGQAEQWANTFRLSENNWQEAA